MAVRHHSPPQGGIGRQRVSIRRFAHLLLSPLAATVILLVALALLRTSGGAMGSSLPPVGWSQGAALPGPFVPRWDAGAAYFPPKDQVVLFGGAPKALTETFRNDTWVYSNGAWSAGPPAASGLTPRGGVAMAYLPDIGKLVLFGGADGSWP